MTVTVIVIRGSKKTNILTYLVLKETGGGEGWVEEWGGGEGRVGEGEREGLGRGRGKG